MRYVVCAVVFIIGLVIMMNSDWFLPWVFGLIVAMGGPAWLLGSLETRRTDRRVVASVGRIAGNGHHAPPLRWLSKG